MATGFYQPPWQQMFGPINRRWRQQADTAALDAQQGDSGAGGGGGGIFGLGGGQPRFAIGDFLNSILPFGTSAREQEFANSYQQPIQGTLAANQPGAVDKPPPGYRPMMQPPGTTLNPNGPGYLIQTPEGGSYVSASPNYAPAFARPETTKQFIGGGGGSLGPLAGRMENFANFQSGTQQAIRRLDDFAARMRSGRPGGLADLMGMAKRRVRRY